MALISMNVDTKNFDAMIKTLRSVAEHKYEVRVGIPEGATNDDGEIIAEYAANNEFGAPGIPSRPFMRTTVKEKESSWLALFRGYIGTFIAKDPDCVKKALMLVGREAMMDMKAKVMSHMPPPNNPVYAATKVKKNGGYSGTLFNTGAMYKSINFSLLEDGKVMK